MTATLKELTVIDYSTKNTVLNTQSSGTTWVEGACGGDGTMVCTSYKGGTGGGGEAELMVASRGLLCVGFSSSL